MKKNIFTSKISIKLLLTVAFCLILSIIAGIFYPYFEKGSISSTIFNLLFSMGIFALSFLFIVNKKIRYIKYIAASVKKIANEDLGTTIEILGNDELAELSKSINLMSMELKEKREKEKELENAKNELITNVSHDLRTPLTSIIGYVDLLRRKEVNNEEQQDEYIDTIYHKSLSLQTLINELFEYTKLTTPGIKINCISVDLAALLEQMVGEYIPIFNKDDLTIIRDIPDHELYVNVDIEKIVRVFENILINSKKYSIKPSEVHVKLYKNNNRIITSISNRTDKISKENLQMLFEKFFRADSSRKISDGAGLGLAIAKKIVELHNGRIWVEYQENIIIFNVELHTQDET